MPDPPLIVALLLWRCTSSCFQCKKL